MAMPRYKDTSLLDVHRTQSLGPLDSNPFFIPNTFNRNVIVCGWDRLQAFSRQPRPRLKEILIMT